MTRITSPATHAAHGRSISANERAGNRAGGRRRYSQQKAAGVCAHSGCSAGPAPGRVRCERHLAMVREANRAT